MNNQKPYSLSQVPLGKVDGKQVKLFRIDFTEGIAVELMTYGGVIKSMEVPDRNGKRGNVVLSYSDLDGYLQDDQNIGCLVGRFANRIKNAAFEIDGKRYTVTKNHGKHHLHGGNKGFGKMVWDLDSVVEGEDEVLIAIGYKSENNEEGYPGNLLAKVTYAISRDALKLIYDAETDHTTHYNPTYHGYFNLTGDPTKTIDDHVLLLASDSIIEIDKELIPTGNYKQVRGTVFDFNDMKKIGDFKYDHCYKIGGNITIEDPDSGRVMSVQTTSPGIQLYTSDNLHNSNLKDRSGVCLETQFFPDTPNNDHFPSSLLQTGETFHSETVYRFEFQE